MEYMKNEGTKRGTESDELKSELIDCAENMVGNTEYHVQQCTFSKIGTSFSWLLN